MRVTNTTRYDTEDLRAIAQAVAGRELDPFQRNGLVVRFAQAKRPTHCSGHAWIGIVGNKAVAERNAGHRGGHLTVWLPKLPPDPRELAFVLAHEMAHTRGMDHPVMRGGVYDRRTRDDGGRGLYETVYAYAADFPIRAKAAPARDRSAEQAKAIRQAEAMVKRWETRIKRSETALKSWRRKLAARRRAASTLTLAAEPKP